MNTEKFDLETWHKENLKDKKYFIAYLLGYPKYLWTKITIKIKEFFKK